MSEWTHSVCDACWGAMNGDRQPLRVKGSFVERCCRCGKPTQSGIYVRQRPGVFMHCHAAAPGRVDDTAGND